MAIRGRPPGQVKTGGKQANHGPNTKKMTTAEMRAKIHDDLVAVYLELNKDNAWLLMIAREYPLEWLRQCWTRLAPPLPRSEEAGINNTVNVQIDTLSQWEKARRVGFLLAKAAHELEEQKIIEHLPPLDSVPTPSQPVSNLDLQMKITGKGDLSEQVEPEPKEVSIETYYGSSAEHGHGKKRNLI